MDGKNNEHITPIYPCNSVLFRYYVRYLGKWWGYIGEQKQAQSYPLGA